MTSHPTPSSCNPEVALWQYRWTNPSNEPHRELDCVWQEVRPRDAIQTMEQRLEELRSYSYGGKPCYEVRALYAASAVSPSQAQSDIAEVMRMALAALEKSVDNFQANVQHRAAIVALRKILAAGIQSPAAPVGEPCPDEQACVKADRCLGKCGQAASVLEAQPQPTGFRRVGKADFHMSAEMDVCIGDELYIRFPHQTPSAQPQPTDQGEKK